MGEGPKKPQRSHYDQFYTMIGECITGWSSVEHQLLTICRLCLDIDEKLMAVIFLKVDSLSWRLSLTNDLMEARWWPNWSPTKNGGKAPVILQYYRKVAARLSTAISFRNILAHQPVYVVGDRIKAWGELGIRYRADGAKTRYEIQTGAAERLILGEKKAVSATLEQMDDHRRELIDLEFGLLDVIEAFPVNRTGIKRWRPKQNPRLLEPLLKAEEEKRADEQRKAQAARDSTQSPNPSSKTTK